MLLLHFQVHYIEDLRKPPNRARKYDKMGMCGADEVGT